MGRRESGDLLLSRFRTQDWGGQKVRLGFPVTSYGKTQKNFLTKPIHILRDKTKRKKKKEEPVNSPPKRVPGANWVSTALNKGKGFGNLTTKIPLFRQMGKREQWHGAHTYEDILGNAGENKRTVQRGETTSLQRDTTHFTIKGTFNQNSAKESGLHNVWVFKKYHIPLHHTEGTLLERNGYMGNFADFLENATIVINLFRT